MRRTRYVREDLRPAGPRHLADIDIAMRVDRQSVRRKEFAEIGSSRGLSETADQLTLIVDDADSWPDIRDVAADRRGRADLADIKDRLVAVWHAEAARAMQILPLGLVFAVAVEHLHAVVLAVGDIDPASGIAADIVNDIELALAGAGRAPGEQQLAVRRVCVDTGIAVAVRDVDVAVRRQRGVGAAVERLTRHVGRRLARHAELQQHLAVERDLAHEVPAIVGQEYRVVRRHVDAMRPRILPFAPRAQKIALAVEDHHWVLAAIEDVDVVLAVDADPADFFERPAIGELRPIGVDLISIVAAAHNHRDALPWRFPVYRRYRVQKIRGRRNGLIHRLAEAQVATAPRADAARTSCPILRLFLERLRISARQRRRRRVVKT